MTATAGREFEGAGHVTYESRSKAWLEGRPGYKFLSPPLQSHFCQLGPMARGFHNFPKQRPQLGTNCKSTQVCSKAQQTNPLAPLYFRQKRSKMKQNQNPPPLINAIYLLYPIGGLLFSIPCGELGDRRSLGRYCR